MIPRWIQVLIVLFLLYGTIARYCAFKDAVGFTPCPTTCTER